MSLNTNRFSGAEMRSDHITRAMRAINRIESLLRFRYANKWGSIGSSNGQFSSPTGIRVRQSNGVVYVGDTYNYRIQMFASDGSYISSFGSYGTGDGEFAIVGSVFVDDERERVYVVDNALCKVSIFTTDGAFWYRFGSLGTDDDQFKNPSGVAVLDDEIFVCDRELNLVKVFTLDAVYARSISVSQQPNAISVHDGKLYVSRIAGKDILVLSPDGTVVDTIGGFDSTSGVDASDSMIVVANPAQHTISALTPDGTLLRVVGKQGVGSGQLNTPVGVSIFEDSIYVTEYSNNRVQEFSRVQTEWYYQLRDGEILSMGTPDGGVNVPPIDAVFAGPPASETDNSLYDPAPFHYLLQLRRAIEGCANEAIFSDISWKIDSSSLLYKALEHTYQNCGYTEPKYRWGKTIHNARERDYTDAVIYEIDQCVEYLWRRCQTLGLIDKNETVYG